MGCFFVRKKNFMGIVHIIFIILFFDNILRTKLKQKG